jgi:hypothetical protein
MIVLKIFSLPFFILLVLALVL